MEKMIDLRSDTVTKPSPEMRRAMANAEVGDDVFGEDPTINALQRKAAEILGKETAIFVCSGTMANQLAIRAQTQPGDEIITEGNSHCFNNEGGAAAALSGVQIHAIQGKRGVMEAWQIEEAIRPFDHHYPTTRLICIENTHNRGGGTIYPLEKIEDIHKLAKQRGLRMHLDGARLFNASVASGIEAREYARYFDSVSFCLSKGLGCPVGSLVTGPAQLIDSVHRFRKMYGGGMRQAGILAAAGIYALDHNVARLERDHDNAKKLAQALHTIQGISINCEEIETNILIFNVTGTGLSAQEIVTRLQKQKVLMLPVSKTSIRAVTHLNVDEEDIDHAITVIRRVFSQIVA